MRTQWKEGSGEDEEENVWLSQKTRTKVLTVNDCSWWIITDVLFLYHQLHCVLIQRKITEVWWSVVQDWIIVSLHCIFGFLDASPPGENIHPLLPQKPGSLRWFAWGNAELKHLAKTMKEYFTQILLPRTSFHGEPPISQKHRQLV